MAPCVTPLPRVRSPTVISEAPTIRSNTARRVGSARVRMTASMGAGWFMTNTLVYANALVNTKTFLAGSNPHCWRIATAWL